MNPVMPETPSRVEEAQHLNADRISKFDEMAKEEESRSNDKSIFTPYSFDDVLKMPPKEWLLDQVFGVGDIGMIYGPPGCGKTFVVIDMIVSLCRGQKWANGFDVTRRLNVAYCAGEGIGGLPSRFAAIAKHYDIVHLDNFVFYSLPPQLYDDNATATINHFCDEWKARQAAKEVAPLDVLIIDTLHTATVAADENSAQHMGKVLHSCRLAGNALGCAVILVHHTNKSGEIERGSSALRGAMDFMIKVRKPSDTAPHVVMSCEKLKDREQWESQSFSLQPQVECKSAYVSWNDSNDSKQPSGSKASDKEKLKAEMKRYEGTRLTCKTLAEAIAKTENYTRNLLKELEDTKECQRELSDPRKKSSSRNPWVYWIDAFQERGVLNG